jgi:hypothetical protein
VRLDCADALSNVERIFVDYHSFSGKKQTLDQLLKVLSNAGFRCYVSHIESHHPFVQMNAYLGMDNQLNIFGLKSTSS